MFVLRNEVRNCALIAALAALCCADAGENKEQKKGRHELMDYGPFIMSTLGEKPRHPNTTPKALSIRLNSTRTINMSYDTELLRVMAGWTNGFTDWSGPAFSGSHSDGMFITGSIQFTTKTQPGWAKDGSFADPRNPKDGPIPADWAKYKGAYLNGERVIVSYTVGDCKVLETPGAVEKDGSVVFTRAFTLGASSRELILNLADDAGQAAVDGEVASVGALRATVAGAPKGSKLIASDSSIRFSIPPLNAPVSFKVTIGKVEDAGKFAAMVDKNVENLEGLAKGGAAHWNPPIQERGTLGTGDGSYVVDTLTAPVKNQWNSWLRFGGFDFFSDGTTAALSTWSGDVWVVKGVDNELQNLSWKRYATGLYQPLGLKIVDDKVYTLGRDGITRLHDLNNDGEADFYENFNNDVTCTPNFHEFAFDLQTDPEGNFYFSKGSPVRGGGRGFDRIAANNGCLMRVSKDGSKCEVFASGLRAPNGIGVGPNGEVTSGDNEGTWQPSCPINLIKKGGFYGVVDAAHRQTPPAARDYPICWMPFSHDNSGGGQTWVTSDKWGPLKGRMLHCSYGKCTLYAVMYEEFEGGVQGGATKFPLTFRTGIMRPRFNAKDGQLYICGLKGWQTTAANDEGFQRVRYTGKPVHMPSELHVLKDGIEITFTNSLDPAVAGNLDNWSGEAFNILYTKRYGSKKFPPSQFEEKGFKANDLTTRAEKDHEDLFKQIGKEAQEAVAFDSVTLRPDGKTVFLKLAKIKPVTNMIIKYRIKAADGSNVQGEICNTINRVPTSEGRVK